MKVIDLVVILAPVAVTAACSKAPAPTVADTTPTPVADTTPTLVADTTPTPADTVTPLAAVAADMPTNTSSPAAAAAPLAAELADRIRAMTPGCVGISADGRTLLYIDEGIREAGSGRETWLYYIHADRDAARQKWAEWPLAEPLDVEVRESIATTVAGRDLRACKTATGASLNIPSGPPVHVAKQGASFDVDVKGQPTRKLAVHDDAMGDLEAVEGYSATGVAAVFVRFVPADQPEYLNQRVIRVDPTLPEVETLW